MSVRKIGARILAAGVIYCWSPCFFYSITNSVWALITLGLSIVVNTAGLAMLW